MTRLTIVAVVLSAAFACSGANAQPGGWIWTPGLCKYKLTHNGVVTRDGRWFSVQAAYCTGLKSRCLRGDDGMDRYSEFLVNTHSYNGANRFMHLRLDDRNPSQYYIDSIVLANYGTLAQFFSAEPYSFAVAHSQKC